VQLKYLIYLESSASTDGNGTLYYLNLFQNHKDEGLNWRKTLNTPQTWNNMIEIERKFLVKNDSFKTAAFSQNHIAQGYLSSVPERTVRVRLKADKGYLTIKGLTNATGMSRFEWEKEIPVDEAKSLLLLCEKRSIDKTRYEVKVGKHIYEVDEFYGGNQGLIIAEVELQSEEETFEKPDWLGQEVTNDKRYYNSNLSVKPYTSWQ
jgi:adenylate cyclase